MFQIFKHQIFYILMHPLSSNMHVSDINKGYEKGSPWTT